MGELPSVELTVTTAALLKAIGLLAGKPTLDE